MKTLNLVSALQTGYTTIAVQYYGNSKKYTYKVLSTEAEKLSEGSLVVVDTPSNEYKVVTVCEVHDSPQIDMHASYSYKWIVQVVDTTTYKELLANEEKVNKLIAQAEQERARESALSHFCEKFPAGSESRKLFEEALNLGKSTPKLTKPSYDGVFKSPISTYITPKMQRAEDDLPS